MQAGCGSFTTAAVLSAVLAGKADPAIPKDAPRNPSVIAGNAGGPFRDIAVPINTQNHRLAAGGPALAMLLLPAVFCGVSALLGRAQRPNDGIMRIRGCNWIPLYYDVDLNDLYSDTGLACMQTLHAALAEPEGLRGAYYNMNRPPVELLKDVGNG